MGGDAFESLGPAQISAAMVVYCKAFQESLRFTRMADSSP
jgi:hypothetical protein